MGVAQVRLLRALGFRAPFPPLRSLHKTVGRVSQHHAPSCRAQEQVFLPGRSGGSAPLPSQLRGWKKREGAYSWQKLRDFGPTARRVLRA
jgi:hypothetical protein